MWNAPKRRGIGTWLLISGAAVMLSLGSIAGDAAAGSKQAATVSVSIINMRVSKLGNTRQFLHDRVFTETAGVGVTLTEGTVCVSAGACNGKAINYRIEPNTSLHLTNHVVIPVGADETFDFTYVGTDDNDHPVSLKFRIKVSGEQFEVTP